MHTLFAFAQRLRRFSWPATLLNWGVVAAHQFAERTDASPLRAALFNAEQLAQGARELAAGHRPISAGQSEHLLRRLRNNAATLAEVYERLLDADQAAARISPAGEWLLDNYYLIEDQIRTVQRHFPSGYCRELPRIESTLIDAANNVDGVGKQTGEPSQDPRVYLMAMDIVAHGDGRIDAEGIRRFVLAYQSISMLTLGECWAIAIMLRLALLENVRRLSVGVASGWSAEELADHWADQMIATAENDPKSLIIVIADMARSKPAMTGAFVAGLTRRLQGRGAALALALHWVEQHLAETDTTLTLVVEAHGQAQAADQVSMANSIASLRLLDAINWPDLVEAISGVEQVLRQDPARQYAAMDFATRDSYRHAVERIARNGCLSEVFVAECAVSLANTSAQEDRSSHGSEIASHIGFYLIGAGLPTLEITTKTNGSMSRWLRGTLLRAPLVGYLTAIGLISGLAAWGLMLQIDAPLGLLLTVALVAASQLGVSTVNWLVSLWLSPTALPRMDYSSGIPAAARSLVVMPCLISTLAGIDTLIEALERHFLANRDSHLHFALLTDFTDAPSENQPDDLLLVAHIGRAISDLNRKYPGDRGSPPVSHFFLLHRPRRWNPAEACWMGYERKRGKLMALNALLRGRGDGEFSVRLGDLSQLQKVRYVITLDADTQLPADSARQLIAAMAHPLNRPVVNAALGRVVQGYAILQPRVAHSLAGTQRSRYGRLYGDDPGMDPYSRACSDLYQDLFGQGSFIGKGIYDVDAFSRVLDERFPENRILSHDLLESCYARSGLASDVTLYEEGVDSYLSDVGRRERWVRGDWQLISWLGRAVPLGNGGRQRNPLDHLAQWKLFDNLRRSVVPLSVLILLLAGWVLLPGGFSAVLWTSSVLGLLYFSGLAATGLELLRLTGTPAVSLHWATIMEPVRRRTGQGLFELACLPYEAVFLVTAAGRALWRMYFSHANLLVWRASGEKAREAPGSREGLWLAFRTMFYGPVLSVLSVILLSTYNRPSLGIAAPILLLWFVSPGLSWWLSQAPTKRTLPLTADQTKFLGTVARRTWTFFERFVTAESHWLPPDNYQQYRAAAIAQRTSPTNMGLALLANLGAYDFAYISGEALLERTQNALESMHGLERFRGHYFNWYDIQTRQPLLPLYVSSVDSGNLAGHLLTLRAGLLELADAPAFSQRVFQGLLETYELIAVVARSSDVDDNHPAALLISTLRDHILAGPSTLGTAAASLRTLDAQITRLCKRIERDIAAPANQLALDLADAHAWGKVLLLQCRDALADIEALLRPPAALQPNPVIRNPSQLPITASVRSLAAEGNEVAIERLASIHHLARRCQEMATMEYDFLVDPTRHLFSIGYNVSERRADSGFYDLLASEARLGIYVSIAQGALGKDAWFALGRRLTSSGGSPVMLSWSGSMFEYLMPLLVMPNFADTLLNESCSAAVARQIAYGAECGLPWGVSESGYALVDLHLNYQYRAFGVPGLGLRRGLADDLVVAPYASALALMIAPRAACENLQRLASEGLLGEFGFFEAVDYTPQRQRRGQTRVVVRAFMAHHQGMSLLALAHHLLEQPMQRRFAAEPMFQAISLLLQERVPQYFVRSSSVKPRTESGKPLPAIVAPLRTFKSSGGPVPEMQLLSNGRYHMAISQAGGGYSRWQDLALTRWREDGTCDNAGLFCYLREVVGTEDVHADQHRLPPFWSNSFQPTLKESSSYEALFSEGRAEFRRQDAVLGDDGFFETHTEIVVSPEDDIELRRVRITNRSRKTRTIELTSYAEVVIAPAAAAAQHPAFSNLFVQTEILRERSAIVCMRRPRSPDEPTVCLLHLLKVRNAHHEVPSFETDRARFIGRTRTLISPAAMNSLGALSGSQGSVLDPIVSIRSRITLLPDEAATIDLVTGISPTRALALALIDKYQDKHLADRVFDLSWTHGQVLLRQLNATDEDAQIYARLAGSVIYRNPMQRAPAELLARNRRGQSGLWGYGLSGDLPIVLVQIADAANIALVEQVIQAHSYWRLKGLSIDLVIWNEEHTGYRQQLQDQIMGMLASDFGGSWVERPGGVFVRQAEQMSAEDRILFQAVARVVLRDDLGTLAEQAAREASPSATISRHAPTRAQRRDAAQTLPAPTQNPLEGAHLLSNGLGGFSPDGREYVIDIAPGDTTPAPWVNVLANSHFGSIVAETGAAYTWRDNAHEFRLSPWANDAVCDGSGEAIYLRDEETGVVWSPCPWPARAENAHYRIRHGFGYSVFETQISGIRSELWVYVASDAAVKFSVVKLHNCSGRGRHLSITGYVQWVLADLAEKSALHVRTEMASSDAALYAQNHYSNDFAEHVAFFDVDGTTRYASGDRCSFVGRNGSLAQPAALGREHIAGALGAGLDPCGALQVMVGLSQDERREIAFRLGAGTDRAQADELVQRMRAPDAARNALDAVQSHWQNVLGAIQVKTPEPALDLLVNGWLIYQTIACRLWARSGSYQSGGAFGFRDQLQDVMALLHTRPDLARVHILLCASRQFSEGDVQHWWHPPTGRGVRTRCSDDYLWLPLAVAHYVRTTGDASVLAEVRPFLDGRLVPEGEDSYFDLPLVSAEVASVYEHCVRALRRALKFGDHGLPLMGSGDWNDGMNLVGIAGKGESVWLGFFLSHALAQFAPIAEQMDDAGFALSCRAESARLLQVIEQQAWDGQWYRRAYFDDGSPLGTASGQECRIDSISQSWSVLSRALEAAGPTGASGDRARMAMDAVDRLLMQRDSRLLLLLAPPFDEGPLNPGYIRGYVPGVRENGGQYTHAAIWAAMAFAALGDSTRAWKIFDMINPLNHARSPAEAARYKVEPYVMSADVYAVPPHTGRGGWSWYTGSAGWMYRLIVESLLGIHREGENLSITPLLPAHWPELTISYRWRSAHYRITVRTGTTRAIQLNGHTMSGMQIPLCDDGREHQVLVYLPPTSPLTIG